MNRIILLLLIIFQSNIYSQNLQEVKVLKKECDIPRETDKIKPSNCEFYGSSLTSYKNEIIIGTYVGENGKVHPISINTNDINKKIIHKEYLGGELSYQYPASDNVMNENYLICSRTRNSGVLVGGDNSSAGISNNLPTEMYTFQNNPSVMEKNEDGLWQFKQFLKPNDNIKFSDSYGSYVDLQDDYAFVGDGKDSNGGPKNSGAVYIFKRNDKGEWKQFQKLIPNKRIKGARFGSYISVDNDNLFVGAVGEGGKGKGAGYLFKKQANGDWVEEKKIVVPNIKTGDYAAYGTFVGEELLMPLFNYGNEGGIHVYKKTEGGEWNYINLFKANDIGNRDFFGRNITILNDGRIATSAYKKDLKKGFAQVGSVYIFKKDSKGLWVQDAKIVPSEIEDSDGFRGTLEFGKYIVTTNNYLVIGSYQRVFIYKY